MSRYEVFAVQADTTVYTYPDLTFTNKSRAIKSARLFARPDRLHQDDLGYGVFDRRDDKEVFFLNTSKGT